MTAISQFVRANPVPLGVAVALLLIGGLVFEFVLGLSAAVAAGLWVLVVVATLGVYRLLNRVPVAWSSPLAGGRLAVSGFVGVIVIGLLIQAVPFGWDHSNPPVTGEPAWDSPRTRELMVLACFDCHSNEVAYPWYSRIAPMSWAVHLHVEGGRGKVNYSEWDRPQREAGESTETVIEREMPPGFYTLLAHGDARLTDTEIRELVDGLEATLAASPQPAQTG